MKREQAIKELKRLHGGDQDVECAHGEADDILCDLLRSLGYEDVVEEWIKVEKWYA